MDNRLFVSVIIPVCNAREYLDQCLGSIMESSYLSYEIIVVDDASTDDSAEIARRNGARVFRLPVRSGPAAARNYGSREAKGDILFFVDADVLIGPETIARLINDFNQNRDIAAVFGSYDDSPVAKNFISQYKNLLHHFVHQQSSREAMTFWAGCGAIRGEVFQKVRGFDEKRYTKPCIEDIELGYRMKKLGYQIVLDKDLQVKHLKEWKLGSLLQSDILSRAIPWSRLILESQTIGNDLNLKKSHRISAGLVGLLAGILPFSLFEPRLIYGILLLLAVIFLLNYDFYRFLIDRKGFTFLGFAFPLHLLYYFYSGVTFVSCWVLYSFSRRKLLQRFGFSPRINSSRTSGLK